MICKPSVKCKFMGDNVLSYKFLGMSYLELLRVDFQARLQGGVYAVLIPISNTSFHIVTGYLRFKVIF